MGLFFYQGIGTLAMPHPDSTTQPSLYFPAVVVGCIAAFAMANGYLSFDAYRFSLLLFIFGVVLFCIITRSFWKSTRNAKVAMLGWGEGILMAMLVGVMCFSTDYIVTSEVSLYITYVLAVICASSFKKTRRFMSFTSQYSAVVAFALLYACSAFIIFLSLMVEKVQIARAGFLPWGFENIRYWSHIATWLLPILPLGALLWGERLDLKWRSVIFVVSVLWWWVVLLSVARGTMLGLFAGLLSVCWLAPKQIRKDYATFFLKVFFAGLCAWLVLEIAIPWLVFGAVEHKSLSFTSSGRLPQWREAFAMSLVNFPFGMGPQSWLTHEPITDSYWLRFGHPHNMYLLWAAEYGWLFLATLGLFVFFVLKRAFQRVGEMSDSDPASALILLALLHSFIAACVHAGVSAVFIGPASLLVGWFVMVGILRMTFPAKPDHIAQAELKEGTSIFSIKRALRLLMASMLIPVFYIQWEQTLAYKRASDKDALCYPYSGIPTGNGPRFWLHGDFPRPPSMACDESKIPPEARP